MSTKSYASKKQSAPLEPFEIIRRKPLENDVKIEILYCGVCHSDLHFVEDDWGMSSYPLVPGHEIVGKVIETGKGVKKFNQGDLVGIGCMVDSCQNCTPCSKSLEQYCESGFIGTYGAPDQHSGGTTFGGYSKDIVVDQKFVLNVSKNLDTKKVAPLLCAGITTYSPLKHWNIKQGDKVAVVGFGGLGHMGIKFAKALGSEVTVITRSKDKIDDAMKIGATKHILSTNEKEMQKHAESFDFILNTIPVTHDVNPYLALLKLDKTMCIVGSLTPINEILGANLIMKRKNIAGSLIGGIKETQEMLDFCATHNITCDVEMIKMQEINQAYQRMKKSDVKYRFVIDMSSL